MASTLKLGLESLAAGLWTITQKSFASNDWSAILRGDQMAAGTLSLSIPRHQ
jgi:hypothetical protein